MASSPSDRYSVEHDRFSWDSSRTDSTPNTVYSTKRPTIELYESCLTRTQSGTSEASFQEEMSRASVDTYISTDGEANEDEDEEYEISEYSQNEYRSDALPATPRDFSDLFPSSRRLSIAHDDSTIDGNMNLRVDTLVDTDWSSRRENLTLFHLKMNDLKNRECSLRRYCRDSGREVCKTVRKYQTPLKQRSALAKPFSSALNSIRRHNSDEGPHLRHLQRNDSGIGSIFSHEESEDDDSIHQSHASKAAKHPPSNTIKLDFSNYSQVELRRRGAGSHKFYQYEFWGHDYTWKRKVKKEGNLEEVSFYLTRKGKQGPLAYIVPVPLTNKQAHEEKLKGGWIPPCSMWITDPEILNDSPDHADLVVATGLLALVDDAIKRKWHSTSHHQVLLPLIRNNSFRMNMEYIGPKRLIDEVFNRRPASSHHAG